MAPSWQANSIHELDESPLVRCVTLHVSACNIPRSRDDKGVGWVKRPIRFMTNSVGMVKTLDKRCAGGHWHIQPASGHARTAAMYVREVCKAVSWNIEVGHQVQ